MHLRQFNRTRFSAIDPSYLPDANEEDEARKQLPQTVIEQTPNDDVITDDVVPSSSKYEEKEGTDEETNLYA